MALAEACKMATDVFLSRSACYPRSNGYAPMSRHPEGAMESHSVMTSEASYVPSCSDPSTAAA